MSNTYIHRIRSLCWSNLQMRSFPPERLFCWGMFPGSSPPAELRPTQSAQFVLPPPTVSTSIVSAISHTWVSSLPSCQCTGRSSTRLVRCYSCTIVLWVLPFDSSSVLFKSLLYTWTSAHSPCPLGPFSMVYLDRCHPPDLFAHCVIILWLEAVCNLFSVKPDVKSRTWHHSAPCVPCSAHCLLIWLTVTLCPCMVCMSLLFHAAGRTATMSLSKSRYCWMLMLT